MEQPEPRDAAQRANSKHQVSEPLQWAAIILSFLLLLTAFYQARTHKQQLAVMSQHLQVTKDTLAETKRIFDLIERPLITARAATIPDMLPNQPLSPTVTFANKGRTIAQDLRVTVEIAAERGGQFYPLGFPDRGARPYGGYVPAPDDELPIHGAPVDARTLDREFLGNVLNGQELFFVHGRGTYRDLADREYQLTYPFRYEAIGGGFVQWSHPAPWPNEAEEPDQRGQ